MSSQIVQNPVCKDAQGNVFLGNGKIIADGSQLINVSASQVGAPASTANSSTGATAITNIVGITQANYNTLASGTGVNTSTLYLIDG